MVNKRLNILFPILITIIVLGQLLHGCSISPSNTSFSTSTHSRQVCTISPTNLTVTSIIECAVRTQLFYRSHGKLPSSLSSLPERTGYANSIVDGYGRELIFEVHEKHLAFISFGKDGLPHGTGEDADIEFHYITHKPDGSLWIGERYWAAEAERRIQIPTDH